MKTERPVPKDSIPDVLAAIRDLRLEAPIRAGEVLVEDACGTGVAIVATKSIP